MEKILKEWVNGSLKMSSRSYYTILCPLVHWKLSRLNLC